MFKKCAILVLILASTLPTVGCASALRLRSTHEDVQNEAPTAEDENRASLQRELSLYSD